MLFDKRSICPVLISIAALAVLPACDYDGGDGTGGTGGVGGTGGTAEPAGLVVLFTSDEHSSLFGCCPEIERARRVDSEPAVEFVAPNRSLG